MLEKMFEISNNSIQYLSCSTTSYIIVLLCNKQTNNEIVMSCQEHGWLRYYKTLEHNMVFTALLGDLRKALKADLPKGADHMCSLASELGLVLSIGSIWCG